MMIKDSSYDVGLHTLIESKITKITKLHHNLVVSYPIFGAFTLTGTVELPI